MTQNTGWIPVVDSLPDEGAWVLVYTEYTMYGRTRTIRRGVTVGKIRDGKWICAQFLGNRVLAWMPLPVVPDGV